MKTILFLLYISGLAWSREAKMDLDFNKVLLPLLNLGELRTRLSRQFKDAVISDGPMGMGAAGGDASIAVSLVDALQRWADALEAQISMMRDEVLDLKTSNRNLKDKVNTLSAEKEMLATKVSSLESDLAANSGESANAVTGLQNDLRVISSSFGDFIDHFDSYSQGVWTNHTRLHDKIDNLVGSHEHLTNKSNAWRSDLDSHRNETAVTVTRLTETMKAIGEEVRANGNRITQNMADTKALGANVQLTLYNASLALSADVEALNAQDEAFTQDFVNVRKTIEFVQGKYERMVNETRHFRNEITKSVEDLRNQVASTREAIVDPAIEAVNLTIFSSLGKLEANLTNIDMKTKELINDVSELKQVTMTNAASVMLQSNVTDSLQNQVLDVATTMNSLQGITMNASSDVMVLKKAVAVFKEQAEYNSTVLQRGFLGLERHFIDMKRKIFETQLQLVNVNTTVQSLGDLRQEVLAIGQAMANTTSLISDRFEDVSSTSMALQASLNKVWNNTNHLELRLTKLEANHTFVTGIVKSSLDDMIARQEQLDWAMRKGQNRTLILESGLTGLMNYTLELDEHFAGLSGNVSAMNNSWYGGVGQLERKIDKAYELYELQGERIVQNANVISSNVTKLSLAANILEAELSRVASNYNSLKKALNRYVTSSGQIRPCNIINLIFLLRFHDFFL